MIANFFNKTKPVIVVNLLLLFAIFYIAATFLFKTIEFSIVSLGLSLAIFIGFIFMLLLIVIKHLSNVIRFRPQVTMNISNILDYE